MYLAKAGPYPGYTSPVHTQCAVPGTVPTHPAGPVSLALPAFPGRDLSSGTLAALDSVIEIGTFHGIVTVSWNSDRFMEY